MWVLIVTFCCSSGAVCLFKWAGQVEERSSEGCISPERPAGHSRAEAQRSCSSVFPKPSSLSNWCGGKKPNFILCLSKSNFKKKKKYIQFNTSPSCVICRWSNKKLLPWRRNTSWPLAVLSFLAKRYHRMRLPGSWQQWQQPKVSWAK